MQTFLRLRLLFFTAFLFAAIPALAQSDSKSDPSKATVMGTVTDANDAVVAGANVVVTGATPADRRTAVTNATGFFEFTGLQPGGPYTVTVSAKGFADWSTQVTLEPGRVLIITGAQLNIEQARTTVNVGYVAEEIATEQVKLQEQQRIFGIIPNFYVVYDQDAVPMTAKLKFKLALKVASDPITFAGITFLAGIYQAADIPNYQQGAAGYGQRVGAIAADGFSDIMIGGAILPSLLHQDPRYYYQGTGTKKSRALHAISSPFVCKGDNGQRQPNYSSIGGDLASSAISNLYYPSSNRTVGTYFGNFALTTAQRVASALVQEFVLSRFTKRGESH
ncbi:MAG TPA: carboxypeptidase-like regulatory domain-containing protein [Candidatus Acidoferrales bacterium]|nr:carboxypeptidase-like regulatory domain-containing protein [Candidatus Acidoferrales bacterium]